MHDIQEIMREERERTLAEINKLPLSQQGRDDVLRVCAAIQSAVNETVVELDRAIDSRVGPAAMRLMAKEIERLNKRFIEAGLAQSQQ